MVKILFSLFVLSLLLTSCSTSKNVEQIDYQAVAKSFVPKDLNTNNKVLLVKLRVVEKWEVKKFRDFFTKNYNGSFVIVPSNVPVDRFYPDLTVYKYVLSLNGGLTQLDFNGISNTSNYYDKTDSTFVNRASSVYILDRTSGHELYETNVINIMNKSTSYNPGSNRFMTGTGSSATASFTNSEVFSFKKLKEYIRILNGDY